MLFLTLTAILLPASSATVVICELRGTMISWLLGCMMEAGGEDPEVREGPSAWLFARM